MATTPRNTDDEPTQVITPEEMEQYRKESERLRQEEGAVMLPVESFAVGVSILRKGRGPK